MQSVFLYDHRKRKTKDQCSIDAFCAKQFTYKKCFAHYTNLFKISNAVIINVYKLYILIQTRDSTIQKPLGLILYLPGKHWQNSRLVGSLGFRLCSSGMPSHIQIREASTQEDGTNCSIQ